MLIAGRYEATGKMKAGGMSEAHKCEDIRLKRAVMLKTLQKDQEQRRLKDEQKALLRLRSNHVVQLLDIVSVKDGDRDIPCLILEFIDGNDLSEKLFNIDSKYLGVLWQIAKGLHEIHRAGIVHRDIKPNNIRQDKEGVVKIIDFGLSREVGVDNHTNAAIGYLPYMAPELLVKGPIQFTTAADVYAFAVVALAIGPNGLPHWCRVRQPPGAPVTLCNDNLAGLDANIIEILQNCLATDPKDRPDIGKVLTEIERVLLCDRHRARIVIAGKVSELDKDNRTASPTISSNGVVVSQIKIEYDGSAFIVKSVVGTVLSNNIVINVGYVLPNSCVLSFKAGAGSYYFATFDISNPEYMA